jgi:hypothetical protein
MSSTREHAINPLTQTNPKPVPLPHACAQLLYRFCQDISKLRAQALAIQPRSAEGLTVLVTGVPGLRGANPSG